MRIGAAKPPAPVEGDIWDVLFPIRRLFSSMETASRNILLAGVIIAGVYVGSKILLKLTEPEKDDRLPPIIIVPSTFRKETKIPISPGPVTVGEY